MRQVTRTSTFVVAIAFAAMLVTAAHAAEIKLLSPIAMRLAMAELIPQFEGASSHKVAVDYATIGVITERVRKGELADVAIVSRQQTQDLEKDGKLVAGSRTDVARVGYALYVRKGTPKPEIQSADALKRTFLATKAITYGDPAGGGPSGIYAVRLMERLGIAAEMKPKTKLFPPGDQVIQALARGEADLALSLMSPIDVTSNIELLGPIPAELQSYSEYATAVVATSKEVTAAKALIAYITSPAGQAILKSRGFETR